MVISKFLAAGNLRPRPDGLLSARFGIWKVFHSPIQDEGLVGMVLPAWIQYSRCKTFVKGNERNKREILSRSPF